MSSLITEGADGDYIEPIQPFVFPPGATRSCVDFTIVNDIILEVIEDLTGSIQTVTDNSGNVPAGVLRINIFPEETTIEIIDNDGM